MNYLIAVAESSRTELGVTKSHLFAYNVSDDGTVAFQRICITQLPHPEEGLSSRPWYHGGVYYATVSEDTIKDKFPNGYEVRPNALVYKLED